ncbi:hypothetical protein EV424DRAFT_1351557 [Suillus variegatus]|nr:hypothetical protein EV424DRAFT_1351557 [Suillus variegatus]
MDEDKSSAYLFTPCYAANNGELETLRSSRNDVEELLQELDISGEERSQLFKSIADAFIQSGQPQSAAIDAIALALCSPTSFDFDPLFKLDAVVSAKDHEAFSLLQLFLNSGLPELHSPVESHPAILEKYEVASILQIELSKVEKWAIDVIRTGLLTGKLSQTTQSLHVYRSSARTFEREQWEEYCYVEGVPSERARGCY